MDLITQLFDDGSSLVYSADYSYLTATPSVAADMVHANAGAGGFLGILDSFGGLVTGVGNTVAGLTSQINAIGIAREKSELARYQASAALSIGKTQADIAVLNAKRGLGAGGLDSLMPLLLLGGVAYAISQAQ